MKIENFKLLSSTHHGRIYICSSCNKIHIEFNNLNFSFKKGEYRNFKNYFLKIDPKRWELLNQDTLNKRKIVVPISHQNLTLIFNASEVFQLQELFINASSKKTSLDLVDLKRFETNLSLN